MDSVVVSDRVGLVLCAVPKLVRRCSQSNRRFSVVSGVEVLVMQVEIDRAARIYVAGHAGLVGSAVVRRLRQAGFANVLTATRRQLDLRDQGEVSHWFKSNRPDYVYLVAGTVGGIMANSTRPAEFIYENLFCFLLIVINIIKYVNYLDTLYFGPFKEVAFRKVWEGFDFFMPKFLMNGFDIIPVTMTL